MNTAEYWLNDRDDLSWLQAELSVLQEGGSDLNYGIEGLGDLSGFMSIPVKHMESYLRSCDEVERAAQTIEAVTKFMNDEQRENWEELDQLLLHWQENIEGCLAMLVDAVNKARLPYLH
jgi:hypothetical protein